MKEETDGAGARSGPAGGTSPAQAAGFVPRRRAGGTIDLKDPATLAWMQQRAREARAAKALERAAARAGQLAETAAERRRRIGEAFDRLLAERAQDIEWTPERRLAFVTALECWGSVERACEKAGATAHSAYDLRKRDTGFAKAWSEALARWRDRLDGALRDATITAYSALAERGGFGERPAVSEKTALFYAQGLRPMGGDVEAPSADPLVNGIDAEAEQAELERRLQQLAERMGVPFARDPAPGSGTGTEAPHDPGQAGGSAPPAGDPGATGHNAGGQQA